MKQKGYVFSLFVFMIFVAVFVMAVTYTKSISFAQDSSYREITMMKISNFARNLEDLKWYVGPPGPPADNQAHCVRLRNELKSLTLPFHVVLDCETGTPPHVTKISVSSPSCDYIYGFVPATCGGSLICGDPGYSGGQCNFGVSGEDDCLGPKICQSDCTCL